METFHTDRELIFKKVFNSHRELLWEAWIHPEYLSRWWGPDGFSTTTHDIEVKPGKVWRFVMHGPDGRDYPNKITYTEVIRPEKIAYRHVDDDDVENISFRVIVTFEEQGDNTALTMRMIFGSPGELERVSREYGAVEGAEQTLGRLGELLENSRELPT